MFRDGPERLIVFRRGDELFALALSRVDEVVDMPDVQPVPESPAGVLGVATVRGSLVTVYSPDGPLNVVSRTNGAALLLRHEGRRVALAVDDVDDTLVAEGAELLAVPRAGKDGVLLGVIRREESLIALIDADALLDTTLAVSGGDASWSTTA